ncbi:phage tail protein [Arachidicoccus terrestris]|uniref:phage tail protein n=1 Tax=Arachidicoccus terrestris TaxID=2875539 RepID=UPI001CC41675|nr:phage tail protein [Arachidicoccus terrestris]UAY56253.1 phage tail protein [Arachidicoccus terrestris]
MIVVDTKQAIQDYQKLGEALSKKELHKGISSAINKTMAKGRTAARRAVSDEYNIPQRSLKVVDYLRSNSSTLTAKLGADSRPLPVTTFSPKYEMPTQTISVTRRGQVKTKDRRRRNSNAGNGVSLEVHKGVRKMIPYAFMTRSIVGVFGRGNYVDRGFQRRHQRVANTGNDLPIRDMVSVSVHTAVINKDSLQKIRDIVKEGFPRALEHELQYRLSKLKK